MAERVSPYDRMSRLLPASAGSYPTFRDARSRRRPWIGPVGLLVAVVAALAVAASIGGAPHRHHFRSQMTVDEFARCGLGKLSTAELTALEGWLNGKPAPVSAASSLTPASRSESLAPSGDPIVAFNTKSHKFHCLSCKHAKQCTKNCIEIRQSAAIERGGETCGVCGGCLR